jgi:hypothetical protein
MSLRDYFAAAALPAIISTLSHDWAGMAYKVADAMLRTRTHVDS